MSSTPSKAPLRTLNCLRASSASSSSLPRPSSSSRSTPHAENSILYVISRVPATDCAPVTPWAMLFKRPSQQHFLRPSQPPASGTTQGQPVATILSPAFTCSTISSLTITSNDRGKEPAGISSVASWTRIRCQSANLERSICNCHLFLEALLHWGSCRSSGSCSSSAGALRGFQATFQA